MGQHIVIVGAGPVGLTAAMRLAHFGIPSTVLEAGTEFADDLRASTFHPPTLDMLAAYGLAQPLIDQGLISRQWQIRMHESQERVVFDLGVLADDTDHPYRLQCEQSRLVRLLAARLQDTPEVTLHMGCRVTAVSQDADSVTAHATTADGEIMAISGRLLIAADGARSPVREHLGLTMRGETYPETTILATTRFPFEDHLEGLSNVNYVWTRAGTYSLLRLPSLWRCSLYPDADESIEQALQPEAIERKLQRIVPRDRPYEVMETRPYRVHRKIVDDFRHGRVLLAGDAAHINSPSGGMGMNGGIHDAFALTAAIHAMGNSNDLSALDGYSRSRRPIAADEILGQAHENRTRMQERDIERRRATFSALQTVVSDPDTLRTHLLRSSMITGLRRADELARA
ncbi:FAD-dependent oxidoreductase [Polymorphobacter sp.]|uniref:FAD-dependent oxidoreductase n=1 Tax=Polymorphobacter sp. TaxID=1909290 RepID=UPI003F6F10A0